jgi:hypothetical protein
MTGSRAPEVYYALPQKDRIIINWARLTLTNRPGVEGLSFISNLFSCQIWVQ